MKLIEKIGACLSLMGLALMTKPALAQAVNWGQFSGSVNKGFSKENIYDTTKLYAFVASIIAVIIIIAVFHWWSERQQQQQKKNYKQYKEKQKEMESKAQNPAHKRKWFRLRTQAELRWIPADQADHVKENRYFVDQLVDISAEGMCFSTAEEITAGEQIRFLLDIGEERFLPIIGEVLRLFDAEASSNSHSAAEDGGDDEAMEADQRVKHNVAISFIHMTPGDNNRLVAWITKRQRDAIHNTHDQEEPKESGW